VPSCAPHADGTLYDSIVRRRCRCLDCGQVRIDKEYAFTPNANPFSHLLAKTAKLHRKGA
jgi:hypothetical protein